MKVFKIAMISIAVILAVCLAAAYIFIKTFDLNRYLPPDTPAKIMQARKAVDFSSLIFKRRLHITMYLGAGTAEAGGDVGPYLKARQFTANVIFNAINLEDLADTSVWPVVLKGKLSGHAVISFQGIDPKNILSSLKGQGEANITDGVVERLNILKSVLGSTLSFIPGFADTMDHLITGGLEDQLGADATVLDKAQAKFTVADKVIFIDDALAATKALEMNAKGSVGFNGQVDILTNILIREDLSARLVKKAADMGKLQDDRGRIKITGQVKGTVPDVKFVPSDEVRNVTKGAIIDQGSKKLQKIIDKNPGLGKILSDESTKKILGKVLDQIFK